MPLGSRSSYPAYVAALMGRLVRSFDYEWYPTPEYAERPSLLASTLARLLGDMQGKSES